MDTAKLLLIRGPICAGKTTVGEALRRELPQASHLLPDQIKLQIDNLESSDFRRQLAHNTIIFLARGLLKNKRLVIVEVHGRDRLFYDQLIELAKETKVYACSVLLYPDLRVCLARNKESKRGLNYVIPDEAVKAHWEETFRLDGEPVFDTGMQTGKYIVTQIRVML